VGYGLCEWFIFVVDGFLVDGEFVVIELGYDVIGWYGGQ